MIEKKHSACIDGIIYKGFNEKKEDLLKFIYYAIKVTDNKKFNLSSELNHQFMQQTSLYDLENRMGRSICLIKLNEEDKKLINKILYNFCKF
jgi:hypothetical protein